jgi:uncharacterized protein
MLTACEDQPVSRISSSIDFEKPGKQAGYLRVPYSSHDSAYGWIPVPVVSISNGNGPTALLIGGNHGDEYEGQIALLKLCRTIDARNVRGRLIILPAVNQPAALAGRRVSPIDGGNLNRMFPGDPDGSPTEMIADFIETRLLPISDYVLDLHAGGSSLHYKPTILARLDTPPNKRAVMLEALRAFGAPFGLLFQPLQGEDRTMSAAAVRRGVVYLCPELGGSGTVTQASLALAEGGVRRALAVFGLLSDSSQPTANTQLVTIGGFDNYVYAPDSGLFEPSVEPGHRINAGEAAGLIHFSDTPWREPTMVRFGSSGVVLCRRVPTLTKRGDCLYQVGHDFSIERFVACST